MKSRLCFRVDGGLRGSEETPEFVTEPVDVVVAELAGAAGDFGDWLGAIDDDLPDGELAQER